jgi:hypothetical protein
MRRRLAVLGVTGVVLIAMAAGAIRIYHLEQRVASLEAAARPRMTAVPITPVVSTPITLDWAPSDNNQPALQLQQAPELPKGATRHEINGMTYYVMPLAANTANADGVTIQR